METTVEVTEPIETTLNKFIVVLTNKFTDEYFATVTSYQDDQFPLTTVGETQTYTNQLDFESYDLEDLSIGVIVQTMSDNKVVLGARYYPVNDLMDPVAQETMLFGDVEVGTSAVLPITITNYWDTPLTGLFISQGVFIIQATYEVPAFQSMDFEMKKVLPAEEQPVPNTAIT